MSHRVVALVAEELVSHGAKLTRTVADHLPFSHAVHAQPKASINPSNHLIVSGSTCNTYSSCVCHTCQSQEQGDRIIIKPREYNNDSRKNHDQHHNLVIILYNHEMHEVVIKIFVTFTITGILVRLVL